MNLNDCIIGIDLSLTSTGVATSTETFSIATKLRGMERLEYIEREVSNLLLGSDCPVVAIEGYAMAKHGSHAHAQGELGGIIRLLMHKNKVPYIDIPPTNRAKFATGKGNAGKSEVVSTISAITGIIWSGSGADDECDAWVLREMVACKLGQSSFTWTKKSLDALDKIDWSPLTNHPIAGKIIL